MRTVEQVSQYGSRRTGAKIGHHAFICSRRNFEFRAGLVADFFENILQCGVVGDDGQFAFGEMHSWRYSGNLFEGQWLQRCRSVGRQLRLRLLLRLWLFLGFTNAAPLGSRAGAESEHTQARCHRN